ncbi:MAG: rhodanese-like domain-containing protein [bacterium]|nr:rhodanese-like domain-containing protein [bacterium]
MTRWRKTVREAIVLAMIGAGLGLAGNMVRARPLPLGEDHFKMRTAGSRGAGIEGAGAETGEGQADGPIANPGIVEISLDQAIDYFSSPDYLPGTSDTRYLFIDARDDEAYEEGRISGAVQVDHYRKQEYLPDVLPIVEQVEQVIVYCNGGKCEDSILVAMDLLELGVPAERILLFKDGWEAWLGAGLDIETGE